MVSSKKERNYTFLGVDKRYVQTYTGLLHAISSLAALIFGNYLYARCILLGSIDSEGSSGYYHDELQTLFYVSALVSGLTLLPFWDKVQSWQLSTTTLEEKGLSHGQMQNFNRGRGVLATILAVAYPLIHRHSSEGVLKNVMFSRAVGAVVATVAYYQYTLIRDYGKTLFIVYGGSKLGYSLHLMLSGDSLYSLKEDYPYAMEYLEKEALLVVGCVQFGFMWYYLHSRKLASKELVQNACKRYHPIFLFTFVIHITMDKWWKLLPWSISWVMFFNTIFASIFFVKMVRPLFVAADPSIVGDKLDVATKSSRENCDSTRRRLLRRSSSVFDVHNSRTGRRSSIFESFND